MTEGKRGKTKNTYARIIEKIFLGNYTPGATEVYFRREQIVSVAKSLRVSLPKNLGDVVYSGSSDFLMGDPHI